METGEYTAADLAKIELEFAQHIAGLNGWLMDRRDIMYDGDRQVAEAWLADGRMRTSTKDRRPVIELTDAGWAWYRENAAA